MRRFLYVSESLIGADRAALAALFDQSRACNLRSGVTGLLWSDGWQFAQVLEGSAAAVGDTMARIAVDPRHRALRTLHDAATPERAFGHWAMIGPAAELLARPAERAMLNWLTRSTDPLALVFADVIGGARRVA